MLNAAPGQHSALFELYAKVLSEVEFSMKLSSASLLIEFTSLADEIKTFLKELSTIAHGPNKGSLS